MSAKLRSPGYGYPILSVEGLNMLKKWSTQAGRSNFSIRLSRTSYLSYHKQLISTKKLDATGSGQVTDWLKSQVDGEYLIWLTRGRMRSIFLQLNYRGSSS